jgi:hypothetical protein
MLSENKFTWYVLSPRGLETLWLYQVFVIVACTHSTLIWSSYCATCMNMIAGIGTGMLHRTRTLSTRNGKLRPTMTTNALAMTSMCKAEVRVNHYIFQVRLLHWRTEGGSTPPPPKFRSFDKAEPNSQFRGKYVRNCLVFLFHHPN